MGGDDRFDNLVNLTPEEHYIAHLLLVKMYPNHKGLVWAAVQLTGHPNGKRRCNKMYGWLKRKYQLVAMNRTGQSNGSFGSIWINEIGTTNNTRIDSSAMIPDGWQIGRRLNEDVVIDLECKCIVCGIVVSRDSKYCVAHRVKHQSHHARISKQKIESIQLFHEYMNSDCLTIKDFGELIGRSQPNISRSWKRHLVGYGDMPKSNTSKDDYLIIIEKNPIPS